MDDFYDLLGVSEDASTDEINRAWREKARTYHPDLNDDTRANAQFKTLKKAHEVLSDETERAAYDRMGHAAYVHKRLDGLPTTDPPRPPESASGSDADDSADAGGNGADKSASTRADRSNRRNTWRTSGTSAGTGRSNERNAWRTSEASDAGGESTERRSETAESAARRRRPLWYGWAGVFAAGLLYIAGLSRYLRANAAAVTDLRAAVVADPVTGLTATRGLLAPGTFVLRTATTADPPSLLFPVGVCALALAFVAVVAAFGRGSAYLYLVGGAAPLFGLAVGPVLALPDGAVLALVVLCPLAATLLFLVDVGRVLIAGS